MMNALTIADLDISRDLDRDALAIVIGGAGWGYVGVSGNSYSAWSGYYNGQWKANFYVNYGSGNQLYKSRYEYTRSRVQYETSLWDWFY